MVFWYRVQEATGARLTSSRRGGLPGVRRDDGRLDASTRDAPAPPPPVPAAARTRWKWKVRPGIIRPRRKGTGWAPTLNPYRKHTRQRLSTPGIPRRGTREGCTVFQNDHNPRTACVIGTRTHIHAENSPHFAMYKLHFNVKLTRITRETGKMARTKTVLPLFFFSFIVFTAD